MEKKPKEKKNSGLKPKEIEFVDKLLLNDNNGTKTAHEVYGMKDLRYAAVKAGRVLRKPEVIHAIEQKRLSLLEALNAKGVTTKKIAAKIDVLLEATKDGGDPDYVAIDKGIAHATKIHGIEDDGPKQQTGNTYNFIFSQNVQEKVRVIDAEIKNMLTKTDDQDQDEIKED